MKRLVVMASRGCPYQCTYCCNHYIKSLYPNSEKYLRFKSVDKLIDEIKSGLNKYPFLETVRFFDDTLSIKRKWFAEFVEKYSIKIHVGYFCNDRPNHIRQDIAAGYKKSGCELVEMGIESGNENIRNRIMKRFLSDKQTIDAFRILKSFNIKTTTFNILGVPSETIHSLLDTVKLNAKAGPDIFTNAFFRPFNRTKISEICEMKNVQTDREGYSFFEKPILSLDTVSEHQLIFVYKYFKILVTIYRGFMKFPRYLSIKFIAIVDKLLSSQYFPYRFFNRNFVKIDSIFLFIFSFMRRCLRFLNFIRF
ncbi:MAG: radical SAM protein [Candidatus Scalindua sp.]|nr:radical SAM protein [Candidatus Scalindua sp.]